MVPNTQLTSLADIVAPSLAGPAIDERFVDRHLRTTASRSASSRTTAACAEERIEFPRPRRAEALMRALFTPV